MIVYNRLTFGLDSEIDAYAQRLIADNGGLYRWSDIMGQVAAQSLMLAVTGGLGPELPGRPGRSWADVGRGGRGPVLRAQPPGLRVYHHGQPDPGRRDAGPERRVRRLPGGREHPRRDRRLQPREPVRDVGQRRRGFDEPARAAAGVRSLVRTAKLVAQNPRQAWNQYFKACFVAGTPLRTAAGSKPIEDFRVGDEILSRNEFDPAAPLVTRRVTKTSRHISPVLDLDVGGRMIGTTAEHPFYADGRGWTPARELRVGDRLWTEAGDWVRVDRVEDTGRVAAVYNLEVEGDHTYFVGADDWNWAVWSHNMECGVHWTTAQAKQSMDFDYVAGRPIILRPGFNQLLWVERATSKGQLKRILMGGGQGTGARGNAVAIIVDLRGLTPRHSAQGGGYSYLLPGGMPLTGSGGRGLTWWWNTGAKSEINKIVDSILAGRRTY